MGIVVVVVIEDGDLDPSLFSPGAVHVIVRPQRAVSLLARLSREQRRQVEVVSLRRGEQVVGDEMRASVHAWGKRGVWQELRSPPGGQGE